jgi:hypothetical protein
MIGERRHVLGQLLALRVLVVFLLEVQVAALLDSCHGGGPDVLDGELIDPSAEDDLDTR